MPIPVAVTAGLKAAPAVVSILQSLFGGGRGDYQKFDREIAPQLAPIAAQTGTAAFAAWFGEVVGVDAGGNRVVLGSYQTLEQAEAILYQAAAQAGAPLYALWNGQIREFSPVFAQGGNGGGAVSPGVIVPGIGAQPPAVQAGAVDTSTIALLVLAGVAAYFIFGGKKR